MQVAKFTFAETQPVIEFPGEFELTDEGVTKDGELFAVPSGDGDEVELTGAAGQYHGQVGFLVVESTE